MTSLSADTNSRTGKSRLDSSCAPFARMVEHYPLITIVSALTIIWPLRDLGHHTNCPQRNTWHVIHHDRRKLQLVRDWDGTVGTTDSTRWGWPGLVVMFTVRAMTFLSAATAKAKHPSLAVCPSRMEHNSGMETSASNENHTALPGKVQHSDNSALNWGRWQLRTQFHTTLICEV